MKILVVSQRFYPENFRINDIVTELQNRGHQITVLCGLPNYPEGRIYKGYEKGKKRIEEYNGVKVIRVKEVARRNNILFRFLNYYSFPFFANNKINKLDHDFDVILVNQLSPIMMVQPAIKYKKKYKNKILMYSMDLWPESLLAGGIRKDSIIYNFYRRVSKRIYNSMDSILVSSRGHIDYIHELSNNRDIHYLPQYSEDIYGNICKFEKKNKVFTFVFAGNIGKAQNLNVLLEACRTISSIKQSMFKIILVGAGSEKNFLEEKAKIYNLNNVEFVGKKSIEEVIHFYEIADVMVVSLENSGYAKLTLPGKVQSYMAAGKPILSFATGETNSIIEEAKCGLTSDSNSIDDLANNIDKFISMTGKELEQFENNSKIYYDRFFSRKSFMDIIEMRLRHLSIE